jgi:rhodanese-related sulfurtransferase
MGYTNILSFRDGLPEWVKNGNSTDSTTSLPKEQIEQISPAELKENRNNFYLVDIRDSEREKTGVIPGTDAHISVFSIHAKFTDLPKDKTVLIYDTQDKLALNTGRFLSSKGYKSKRLQGGIVAWIEAGNPVDK